MKAAHWMTYFVLNKLKLTKLLKAFKLYNNNCDYLASLIIQVYCHMKDTGGNPQPRKEFYQYVSGHIKNHPVCSTDAMKWQ